jgi:hypothetical protein
MPGADNRCRHGNAQGARFVRHRADGHVGLDPLIDTSAGSPIICFAATAFSALRQIRNHKAACSFFLVH